jgi:hypothetical protein
MKAAFEKAKSVYSTVTTWIEAHPVATVNLLIAAAVIRFVLVFV